jgi:hypothetical protein
VNLKPAQQRVLKHAVKHAPAPEIAPETTPTPPAEEPAAHEEPVKTTETEEAIPDDDDATHSVPLCGLLLVYE